MIRSKGEAGTGNIVEAVRHLRGITGGIRHLQSLDSSELPSAAKELQAPLDLVAEVAEAGWLPVPLFCAGGIATPADASLTMQLGAEGNFVGSGIFKSSDPERRARAIVEATTHAKPIRHASPLPRWTSASPCAATTSQSSPRRASCFNTAGSRRWPHGPLVPPSGEARATSRWRPRQPGRIRRARRGCSTSSARTRARCARPAEIAELDALVIPGGESTTIAKAIERDGLAEPIRAHHAAGTPDPRAHAPG